MPILNFKKLGYASELIRKTFRHHLRKLLVTVALGFVSGLLGGFGISAIVPIFNFAISDGAADDPVSKIFRMVFDFFGWNYNLTFLLIFIGVILAGKAAFTYLTTYLTSRMSADYERQVRNQLLKDTLSSDWPFLMEQKVGHLQTVVMDETQGGAGLLNALSGVILTLTNLISYAIIALNISPNISFITFIFGGISFFLAKPLFYKVRTLSRKTAQTIRDVAHHINEHIIGAKTIKATAVESAVLKQSKDYFDILRDSRVRHDIYSNIFSAFTEPVSFVMIAFIFVYAYDKPGFDFASFAAVIYLIQKIFNFIQGIQGKLNVINSAIPLLESVIRHHETALANQEINTGKNKFSFKNMLSFTDVSFAYKENPQVLSGLTFDVKRGTTVGIVGPSGAGKTTLVDLLLRLLDPASGKITVDGLEIREIDVKDWRMNISYVSQDIFMLNNTISANIRFYDDSITDAMVERAAKAAHISDFIEGLSQRYETVVGERGIRLSGGQRQRIILARALARNPQILVLDEATSALDNESEFKIQEAIKNLKGKLTILIVAHRLSTVMHSDKIIVLKDGVVAESGSPDELLNNTNSYFYKNYTVNERK